MQHIRSFRANTLNSISRQIRNSNAKMVITHPLFIETAAEAAKLAGVEELIVFGHDSVAPNAVAFEDIRGYQSGVYANDECVPSISVMSPPTNANRYIRGNRERVWR